MISLHDYLDKRVRIINSSGKEWHGYIDNVESAWDNEPGGIAEDSIPLYIGMKEGKGASWSIERGQTLSFCTAFDPGVADVVHLHIKAEGGGNFVVLDESRSIAWNEERMDQRQYDDIDGEEIRATDVLLERLDALFAAITSSRLYPVHYPCWDMCEEDESIFDAAEAVYDQHPEREDQVNYAFERLYLAEHLRLPEEGKEYFQRYDRMLREHKVPEGW